MGRHANPVFDKIFRAADRSSDLEKAWRDCGAPTTLGNVQRHRCRRWPQRVRRHHREASDRHASAQPAVVRFVRPLVPIASRAQRLRTL